MENTFVLMTLTASIGLNIYLMFITIPKLRLYGVDYILQLLKVVLLTLKRIKYKVPENTLESLISSIETEINKIETFKDGNS